MCLEEIACQTALTSMEANETSAILSEQPIHMGCMIWTSRWCERTVCTTIMCCALTRAWSRRMLNLSALPFRAPSYLSLPSLNFPLNIILHSPVWVITGVLSLFFPLCVAAERPGRSRRPADSVCVMNRGVPTTLCMAHNTSDPTWLSCLFVIHNRVAKTSSQPYEGNVFSCTSLPFLRFSRKKPFHSRFICRTSNCQLFYLWCNCDVSKTVFDCMSVIIRVTIHVVNWLFVSTCGFHWWFRVMFSLSFSVKTAH